MREIRYRPRNVRETLVELKDTSELAVDLAYSALLSDDRDLAEEVEALEARVEYLQYHARIALMLAARHVEDAERLVGIFQVVTTAVTVTHAAGDIARILTHDVGHPPALGAALPDAPEAIVRADIAGTSSYAGETLGSLDLQVTTGVRVVAIRRHEDWVIDPTADTRIEAGDTLIGAGPDAGIAEFYEEATGKALSTTDGVPAIDDIETAVDMVVRLKTLSEVAVGLAYSATLFDNDTIAREVAIIEERSNELKERLERWVLDAVPSTEHPDDLRGLLHVASAAEVTCDAARHLGNAVLRDVELHPVFAEAILDSKEIITTVTIGEHAAVADEAVADLELETETGMVVLAVRRDGDWLFDPGPDTVLAAGDALIVRGPRGGEPRLRELCGSPESTAL